MAAVNYPITGPPLPSPRPADGSVPLRLELRDLQKNHPDQWNLYLLGLDAFQKQKETDDLSYYGIAGIHGRPYRSWGDKTSTEGDDSAEWQGYCTHSSILFAPWHRPYLALYEQVLYGIIQKIAASFPDSTRARYVQAAFTFRIPYWDWAAVPPSDDQYFPNSVGSTAINVITPQSNGKTVIIPNPLYTYHFDPINPERNDFPPNDIHSKWKTILRYPSSLRSASATSEESMVFEAMQSQFDSLQNNVNLLMNDPNYKKFAAFSNHQWAPDAAPGTYGSLENVHDSIHGEVGGNGGQMGDLDYAAFDPVFWLHHANVDRLFAIWQGLNETSYEINKPDPRGTFTIASNTVETVKTALTPFKDFSGTKFWDSEGVRKTETLAYAYPETQRWKFGTTDAYKNDIRTEVQRLYGGISNEFVSQAQIVGKSGVSAQQFIAQDQSSTEGNASRGGEDFEAEIAANAANPAPVSTVSTKDSSFTLYIANIRARKHILGQTYRVHFFLGDFDEDPSTWHTQVPLVGTFVSLSRTLSTNNNNETNGKPQKHCSKCAEDSASNLSITGTVPLTSSLLSALKHGDLGSLELENVIPFLTKELHWRVTLADGTEIPAANVGGLCVSVVSTEVTVPAGGGFPVYSGVYRVHHECTVGKEAGYGGEGA